VSDDDECVIELRTAHTDDLDAGTKSAIRDLLDTVFDNVTQDTFENTLGGICAGRRVCDWRPGALW
jgi:hypothetical protein